MSQVLSWSVRGAICATGIVGAMAIAACGGDDGTTPSTSSSSSGSPVTPQGPCNGKPVNDCGGCTELPVKVGTTCAAGYNVCKGSDATECKAGDGPPVTALTATTNLEDKVTLSWTPPTTLTPTAYIVSRDGAEYGSAGIAKFDDAAAEAAKVVLPTNVQATDGTAADKVTVTWTAATATAGKAYKYTVTPLYTQNGSTLKGLASNEATGNRAAPSITGYEVQRENGNWVPAGTGTSYDDKDAPAGGVNGVAPVLLPRPHAVVIAARQNPTDAFSVGAGAPQNYRVRAVAGAQTFAAAAGDTGFKKGSSNAPTAIQWQRSSADGDFGFTDVDGMTGSEWYDNSGPTDNSGRFYRAKLTVDGAPVFTAAARAAGIKGTKQAELYQDHGCSVQSDDTLLCWGENNSNRVLGRPSGTFRKVSTGEGGACALTTAGAVNCWGSNNGNVVNATPVVVGAKDVAMARYTTCIIKSDDTLQCWGENVGGNVTPPGGTFKKVYRGVFAFCAIAMDDTLKCWGNNNGNVVSAAPPAPATFKSVHVGQDHGCAIRAADDKLVCWGSNVDGRAPAGPSADTYKAVGGGNEDTCVIRSDDTLECFGAAQEGMLRGRSELKFKALSYGYRSACGIGLNDRFQCAQSRNFWEQAPQLPRTIAYKSAAAGGMNQRQLCAVTATDKRECWGWESSNLTPHGLSTETFKQVAQAYNGGCGIQTDDKLRCWGSLGGNAPTAAATAESYKKVSAMSGRDQVCAIRADDKVVCWGATRGNQPGSNVASAGTYKDIAVERFNWCGIKTTDDTIECFGDNNQNVRDGKPAGAFKALYAHRGVMCGIKADDTHQCWGNHARYGNFYNQIPAGVTYASIAPGGYSTCVIRKTDGLRVCYGNLNGNAVSGVPSLDQWKTTGVVQQNPGLLCGLRADNRFYCSGAATFGNWGSAPSLTRMPQSTL